jgi:hypothetical protein
LVSLIFFSLSSNLSYGNLAMSVVEVDKSRLNPETHFSYLSSGES